MAASAKSKRDRYKRYYVKKMATPAGRAQLNALRLKSVHKRRGVPAPTRPRPEFCERQGCHRKAISLDHCHVTGAFRGWLCIQCNTGIGMLGDCIPGLEQAISYLRRAES